MKKLIGITVFLILLYVALLNADPSASSPQNHFNLGKRIGFFGLLSLGAGLLIIAGGIDLSIGSVVGLSATCGAMLLTGEFPFYKHPVSPWLTIPLLLAGGAVIGWIHGILVTKMRLQAFVVTLCGLFIYRGLSRWLAGDVQQGLQGQFREWKQALYSKPLIFDVADYTIRLPKFFLIFLGLLLIASVILHFSVYGRYWFAIGGNEKAARYSGIATDRYKIAAYMLCSMLAVWAGFLYLMEQDSSQPSDTGNFYELYAIAGAVLGGCSLRGGEGSAPGIFIGTAILVLLPNFSNMLGLKSELEYVVIGAALLFASMMDEFLRRRVSSG